MVDVFERRSGVVARLRDLGARLEFERLPAGDYAIGSEVLVERKTVPDLHGSLVEGRFWSQIGGIRQACRYPHLLVEGIHMDNGPVSPAAIRSTCLAAMRIGVRLLRTTGPVDSALWLHRLADRERLARRDRPHYSQRAQPHELGEVAEAMLAAVPGISTVTARALLERFGTLTAVVTASETDLITVPGVGRKRAHSLATVMSSRTDAGSHAASRSRPCGERPGPST